MSLPMRDSCLALAAAILFLSCILYWPWDVHDSGHNDVPINQCDASFAATTFTLEVHTNSTTMTLPLQKQYESSKLTFHTILPATALLSKSEWTIVAVSSEYNISSRWNLPYIPPLRICPTEYETLALQQTVSSELHSTSIFRRISRLPAFVPSMQSAEESAYLQHRQFMLSAMKYDRVDDDVDDYYVECMHAGGIYTSLVRACTFRFDLSRVCVKVALAKHPSNGTLEWVGDDNIGDDIGCEPNIFGEWSAAEYVKIVNTDDKMCKRESTFIASTGIPFMITCSERS